jgi:hypothetical protein
MECLIYCLVDSEGHVFVKDGAASHSEVATSAGVDAASCHAYRFDLSTRHLLIDRGSSTSDFAARAYCDQHVGSPEKLMTFASEGHLTKEILGSLLDAGDVSAYRDACTAIERQYTADCSESGDPCLESGCAVEGEGEICLEPLLRAGVEYHKACGAAWRTLFEQPGHRTLAWTH